MVSASDAAREKNCTAIGHAALTMAEYFRDDEKKDVLLLIDNIFRFIQAGSEVSGLMGQMPSRMGYQPTLGTELAELEERIANTEDGAVTSIQAVYVPAWCYHVNAQVKGFILRWIHCNLARNWPRPRSSGKDTTTWPGK